MTRAHRRSSPAIVSVAVIVAAGLAVCSCGRTTDGQAGSQCVNAQPSPTTPITGPLTATPGPDSESLAALQEEGVRLIDWFSSHHPDTFGHLRLDTENKRLVVATTDEQQVHDAIATYPTRHYIVVEKVKWSARQLAATADCLQKILPADAVKSHLLFASATAPDNVVVIMYKDTEAGREAARSSIVSREVQSSGGEIVLRVSPDIQPK